MSVEKEELSVVRERYGQLEVVVSSLNCRTRDLLLRERKEFLAAYRAHTYKIQNELRVLRRRVADERSSQQKDSKVKQLTEDAEWFRNEALALDRESTKLNAALHACKNRLHFAEDDRNWLTSEFDRARTASELLRVALSNEDNDVIGAAARRSAPKPMAAGGKDGSSSRRLASLGRGAPPGSMQRLSTVGRLSTRAPSVLFSGPKATTLKSSSNNGAAVAAVEAMAEELARERRQAASFREAREEHRRGLTSSAVEGREAREALVECVRTGGARRKARRSGGGGAELTGEPGSFFPEEDLGAFTALERVAIVLDFAKQPAVAPLLGGQHRRPFTADSMGELEYLAMPVDPSRTSRPSSSLAGGSPPPSRN